MSDKHVAILGAGVWGTAFALHLARIGRNVKIWCRSPEQQEQMQNEKQHAQLPGINLPSNISISCDVQEVINGAFEVICMIPSSSFGLFLELVKPHITANQVVMWGCKGWVKHETSIFFHEVARHRLGQETALVAISGPTFALELAQAKPTAVVLASDQKDIMDSVMQRFHGGNLRCYCTSSMATVQFCGVYKNILAVAAGISDGLELGANARSALITRGIAEMVRIAKSMGLATEPIMGLAGQGDVILSATSDLSRNRRLGLELGRGIDLATIGQQDGMSTLESLNNVAMMLDIAKESGIETPIAEGVNQIISESMSPSGVLTSLLARDPKFEQD